MKKLKISMLALAALALGACTSDDIALSDSAGKAVEVSGDGYVSFAINLPTTPVTRAANDVYDDGLASEYAVNDATLLLFAGESESAATCYASYNLTTAFGLESPADDNITSRSQITQLIDTPASGNIYAMVVLNANGLLSNITVGTATTAGSSLKDLQTTSLNLANATTGASAISAMTTTGFFMCNAPLINKKGGTSDPSEGTVTTLAVIDPENIYSSAAEAEAHPATEIYVERGMAKVTVVDATPETPETGQIAATINGFTLDITNTKSYLVRNTTGAEDWWGYVNTASGDHRMAGSVEIANGLYRTYWATDPNYSDTTDPDDMTLLEGTTPELTACGDETPLYCLENTFNVRHQNDDETTRVIIGATLNDGADFYIWDNDKSTLYTTTTDESVEPSVTTTGLDKIKALILTQLEAEGYMEEAEELWVGPVDETTGESLGENMYDYITIVFDNEEEGLTAGDDLTFTYTVSDDVVASWFNVAEGATEAVIPAALVSTSDEYAAVVADLNSHHQVAYYEGGESYYPVKIKHFGDDLTPWSEQYASTTGNTSNEKSYPTSNSLGADQEDAWLGRYGVLRNNWYEITVTGVTNIGSATVPHAYGDPDDPTEQWISIEINILSWAKRAQSVTL